MRRSPPTPSCPAPPRPPRAPLCAAAAVALLLAGCAGGPGPGGRGAGRDGPGTRPAAELLAIPDAQPRVEPVRAGGPNKPYTVLGRSYQPLQGDPAYREQGLASWYGRAFHGKPTASGEPYDMYAMSAAHTTLPIPSYVRVRNPANGAEAILRVNDRGPFHDGRVIDLSYTAAAKLGLLRGVAPVEVERITWQDIRTGAWQRGAPVLAAAPVPGGSARGAGPAAAPAPAFAPARSEARDAPAPGDAAWAPSGLQAQEAVRAAPPAQAGAADALRGTGAPVAGTAWPDGLAGAVELTARALPPDAVVGVAMRPREPLQAIALPAPEAAGTPEEAAAPAAGFWVQLGAFGQREGAERLRARAEAEAGADGARFAIVSEGGLHRLQAGPFASRGLARGAAERLGGALRMSPVVVERR